VDVRGSQYGLGNCLIDRDGRVIGAKPRELTDEMWRQYREGIEPLKRSGKLVAVHFQFAPWVAYHPRNLEHIEECQRQLDGYQLAVEFRNRTWFEGKHERATLDFERPRGLVNVVVDAPADTPNTVPSVWEVTQPRLAIVRLPRADIQSLTLMRRSIVGLAVATRSRIEIQALPHDC
jgi:uncharacterized protein YecE (DUF72 family)